MGKLEVIFKIRLAYPVLRMSAADKPAVIYFADTGNTVCLEPPQYGPPAQPALDGFEQMVLHVERHCTDEQGNDTSERNADRLQINQDAARAFSQLFDAIREAALHRDNTVFMLPIVPSKELLFNPLIRACEIEWIYEGKSLERVKTGRNLPTIEINDDRWADAAKRLAGGGPVPVYTRFALDAIYFAEHDPPRGIIMACAAWETAMRSYLADVASKREPAYLVASKGGNIPRLYEFVKVARGGPVFYDVIDKATGFQLDAFKSYAEHMAKLPEVRNKLVHTGETKYPEMDARDFALAVLSAIEWLFA